MRKKGFTLVELLIVIGTLLLLISAIIPAFYRTKKGQSIVPEKAHTPRMVDENGSEIAPMSNTSSVSNEQLRQWENSAGKSPADDAARVRVLVGEIRNLRGR